MLFSDCFGSLIRSYRSLLLFAVLLVVFGYSACRKICSYIILDKNLCGRDGRTICGPLRVPKSTYATLAHKRKPKFFYFGCSLVRRFYCKKSKQKQSRDGRTDRQTDRRTDRQSATQYAAPPTEEGRIKTSCAVRLNNLHLANSRWFWYS